MVGRGLVRDVLHDEHLTRGLGDAEARMLVEWLVEWVEAYEEELDSPERLGASVSRLRRRGRAIGHFVRLWCGDRERGAAIQLAASERCEWPLPVDRNADPCEVMADILRWEDQVRERSKAA
jgi:hypothetical protein